MVAAYRGRIAGLGATPAFAAGYLIAWLVGGLLGYVLVEGVRSLDLGFLAWDEAGRYLAGSLILGGALYQADAPEGCVPASLSGRAGVPWRALAPGPRGRPAHGAERGGFCVACCWGLMAASGS